MAKYLGFPFVISAMVEASNFKFGMQLQLGFKFAVYRKITPAGKVEEKLLIGICDSFVFCCA